MLQAYADEMQKSADGLGLREHGLLLVPDCLCAADWAALRQPVGRGALRMRCTAQHLRDDVTGLADNEITDLLIRSTERAAGDTYGLVAVVAAFVMETLSRAKAAPVHIEGASSLLSQPEYRDPDKAHALMKFISNGDGLLPDLPDMNFQQDGLRVTIGPENLAEELKDSSVVMASYDAGGGMRGYIGVVGPTRMDYSGVAAKLSYIAAGQIGRAHV